MTDDICTIFYETKDIISADEIRREQDIGGKKPLLVCKYCFNMKVEIPYSGGCSNTKEKKD